MRTIIAGSRSITDYSTVYEAIKESGWMHDIGTIVSGGANGVDKLGERWAKEHVKPVVVYKANWDKFGKQAGYKRNQDMAMDADALIAIWDVKSKGTANMISLAESFALDVFIWRVK